MKSATRGDLGNDLRDDSRDELKDVSLVAVWLFHPRATAILVGSIIVTSMATLSKEIIILFISILLV